jgi:hypothetical protein
MKTNHATPSVEHAYIAARNVRPLTNFDVNEYDQLYRLGINIDDQSVGQMMAAMDAIQGGVLSGSMTTPIQFLQTWLPGFVNIVTAARKIDDIIGYTTVGSWEDEEIVQGVMELLGGSVPYGDYTNTPYSSWNDSFERRTVVRFEEGLQVGLLEQARAARLGIDSNRRKREAAALALEIRRNSIGFNGFNNGANRTYGFLNDPNLPSYVTVANGAASSPLWSSKTFLEIQKDIITAIVTVRNQSKDVIDPDSVPMTLAIATAAVDRLATTNDLGISVRKWLSDTYPNIRVVSAPELSAANGGANVFYLFADRVNDGSDDGGRTWSQNVPTKFNLNGVAKYEKNYSESYSNATAGALLKRPYAVVRFSGI